MGAGNHRRCVLLQNEVMHSAGSKRWIFAVLLALLFPALAIHASCVAVLGPGNWGSGMEEHIPEILTDQSHPALADYRSEFSQRTPLDEQTAPAAPPGVAVRGRVAAADHDESSGRWVIQSQEGSGQRDERHFYLWSEADDFLGELKLPDSFIFGQPRFIRREGKTFVVLERLNSWLMPVRDKLRRYANSWFDDTLRPERSLYLYDLETRNLSYIGPGHSLAVSPDRTHGALLRSSATASSFHSLHLWSFDSGEIETVVSLHESEPGGGRSFEYRWSRDSRALYLSGDSAGFERRNPQRRTLNHLHIRGVPGLYDLNRTSQD